MRDYEKLRLENQSLRGAVKQLQKIIGQIAKITQRNQKTETVVGAVQRVAYCKKDL